mmetsp:Transcript_91589/g.233042  ORF Transcript_91589/g.233042 Transcript_91589/m.233042 type:complete len:246 (+) Transcript_91589:66-803(+)
MPPPMPLPTLRRWLLPLCLAAAVVGALPRWSSCSWLAIGDSLGERSLGRPRVPRRIVARRNSAGAEALSSAGEYLLSLGMTEEQLQKVTSRYGQKFNPEVNGSVKPLLQWLTELGLTDEQSMKAIAMYPALFRHRLEASLKLRVQWMTGLGMDGSQIAKAIACFPHIHTLSLEDNLKPKAQLLRERGFTNAEIASTLAKDPQLFSYSSKRLAHRMGVLQALGLLTETSLRSAMQMTDAKFRARFE